MTFIWSLLGFLLALGILVTLHEWGHYIVGRFFNIKVEKFSIGFGKPIWVKQRGETQFQLAMIPLGGYVKFADEREGTVAKEDLPRAFNRQPLWQRFLVVLAGPAVNVIFAWLAFAFIFAWGVPQLKPLVERSQATTQPWEVISLNDQPIQSWQDFQQKFLNAVLQDGDAPKSHTVVLKAFEQESYWQMALQPPVEQDLKQALSQGGDVSVLLKQWFEANGLKVYRPPVPAVIDRVLEGSPAQLAGLQPGDEVIAINEQPIQYWQQLVEWVAKHPNTQAMFKVLREGQVLQFELTLGAVTNKKSMATQIGAENLELDNQKGVKGFLGASVKFSAEQLKPYLTEPSYGVWQALQLGWEKTISLTLLTGQMIQKMLTGVIGAESLSGPIGIAQVSGQALQTGWISFIGFLAVLSLSLGLLNLLPIPMLDGGHLLLYLIEAIRGYPINEAVQGVAQMVGLFLILSLTLFAILNDLNRLTVS